MTELQAEQIRKMRTQGIGYRAIASVVGLSRDIVRNYCRAHGMDGYASALTKNIQEQMMLGKACLYCGAELIQPSTGRPTVIRTREKKEYLTIRFIIFFTMNQMKK